jgi:serine/threonine protein kinase
MEEYTTIITINQGIQFILPENYEFIKNLSRNFTYRIEAFDKILKTKVVITKERFHPEDYYSCRSTLQALYLNQSLISKHSVTLLRVLIPPDFSKDYYFYYITKSMETNLLILRRSDQSLTEDHLAYFAYQMLIHTHTLHRNDAAMFYLTPKNILINSDCELKFSMTIYYPLSIFSSTLEKNSHFNHILMPYISPELIFDRRGDFKSDLWNIGCILFEAFKKETLFPNQDRKKLIALIFNSLGGVSSEDIEKVRNKEAREFLNGLKFEKGFEISERLENASPVFVDFLMKMLTFDSEKRISSEEALLHPFLSRFFNKSDLVFNSKIDHDFWYSITQMEWPEQFYHLKDLSLRVNP